MPLSVCLKKLNSCWAVVNVSISACFSRTPHRHYIYIYSFSWRFYPKRLIIATYVRGRTPLEQLGVKCLAQGHIWVSPKACVLSTAPSPPLLLTLLLEIIMYCVLKCWRTQKDSPSYFPASCYAGAGHVECDVWKKTLSSSLRFSDQQHEWEGSNIVFYQMCWYMGNECCTPVCNTLSKDVLMVKVCGLSQTPDNSMWRCHNLPLTTMLRCTLEDEKKTPRLLFIVFI